MLRRSLGFGAVACLATAGAVLAEQPTLEAPPVEPLPFSEYLKRTEHATDQEKQAALEELQKSEKQHADDMKAYYARTGVQWASSLDPLQNGQWQRVEVSADGTLAAFVSTSQLTRIGDYLYAWVRTEYRESREWNGNIAYPLYKSAVSREKLDCIRSSAKFISQATFANNNLDQPNTTEQMVWDENAQLWNPVVPGTVEDSVLAWACKHALKAGMRKR